MFFNKSAPVLLALALSGTLASWKATASGIPVVDALTRDTVAAVGTQISGSISVQTDALSKLLTAHSNNNFYHMKAALAYESQVRAMKDHDPNLVKPREACSLISLAKKRSVNNGMVNETAESLKKMGGTYLESGVTFEKGGATNDKQANRIVNTLANLQKARAASQTGFGIMSDNALDSSNDVTQRDEAAEKFQAMSVIAFPYVKPLPEGDFASQTATLREKRINAPKGVFIERQKIVSDIFADAVARQDRIIDSEPVKQWAISDGMNVDNIPQKISAIELRRLKTNMRINSPAWLAAVSGKNDVLGLTRSQNLMMAEALPLFENMITLLERQEKLLGYMYAAMVEANGEPNEQL